MSSSILISHFGDGILWLDLNDRKSGNALSLALAQAIEGQIDSHKNELRALVLSASGRVFCSGGNLSDYAQQTRAAQGLRSNQEITRILKKIEKLPFPTIALVTGDCFGGGVELISAFDHLISVPDAFFGLWQRRIGLSFGWGGGARLLKRITLGRLSALAMSTRTFTAQEALQNGLIDQIALRSQMSRLAETWLSKQFALPQKPVAFLKIWIGRNELSIFRKLWWNPEHRAVLKTRIKGRSE
jgi:enoyl-CoA hydratase